MTDPLAHAPACETGHKLARLAAALLTLSVLGMPIYAAQAADRAVQAADRAVRAEAAQPASEAEPAAEGHPWLDVLARVVNFSILAGSLWYLLRSPIGRYLVDRGQQIRADLVNAAELKQAAATTLEDIDRKMKALPGELEAMRTQGAEEIAAEERRIADAAAAERVRLLDQTRREIELQVKVAERDLVAHAADLAVGVAAERIKHNITDEDQQRLVDRYVQQLRP